jgi:hypothetical protein
LAGGILQRTLRNEDAAATLRAITVGEISCWLLAWLPLMQGGAEPSIIDGWKRVAARDLGEYDRGILAPMTLQFAALAKCRAEWQRGLEGWTMLKSEYLEELREEVRNEARAEGRVEGRAEGQAEALRVTIRSLGRQRFGKAASRKQKAQLEAITDPSRLERLRDRLLDATSWADLLATP